MYTLKKIEAFRVENIETIFGGHEITAKVTVNKAKMADKAMNAMTQYISS